jgi:hypothetical protein
MIDLTEEGLEVLAVWYVELGGRGNWLAMVSRVKEKDPRWELRYRFRWYAPGGVDPFDDEDVRTWYRGHGVADDNEETMIAKLDAIAARQVEASGGWSKKILVRGDGKKASQLLIEQPWSHVKIDPK